MNKRKEFLPKTKNTLLENEMKLSSMIEKIWMDITKKGESNTSKYHIPRYDRGIWKYDTQGYSCKWNRNYSVYLGWGNRIIPIWHIPRYDGSFLKWGTWWMQQK